MTTQTLDPNVIDVISNVAGLSENAKEKLADYVRFLRYEDWLEEQEEAEDIADAEARRGEPSLPFEEVIAKFEAQHGPLD